jgi:hypothetical protein
MTTATGAGAGTKRQPDGRTLHRAEGLLRRGQLHPEPNVDADRIAVMLARVLDRHDPLQSEHGRLLVAALSPRSKRERRAGPRPPAEAAGRRLLAQGQAPWPKAVAAAAERHEAYRQARGRRADRLAPVAARDGPRAAQLVIDFWRERGQPPSPTRLGYGLGWNAHETWALVHQLVNLGWLAVHRGQLHPGPCARRPAPAAPVR